MKIKRIEHVGVVVRNLEASRKLWEDCFGIPLGGSAEPGNHQAAVGLDDGGRVTGRKRCALVNELGGHDAARLRAGIGWSHRESDRDNWPDNPSALHDWRDDSAAVNICYLFVVICYLEIEYLPFAIDRGCFITTDHLSSRRTGSILIRRVMSAANA